MPAPTLSAPDHSVAVIGAGPGGIAAGVTLKRAGGRDLVVLVRAEKVGGRWRDNGRPELEVDIPSLAYRYSFARNPHWGKLFASGPEVKRYRVAVARQFGSSPNIRFGTTVVGEEWDHDRPARTCPSGWDGDDRSTGRSGS
ncbi:NAD(P)-binding protein [Nocardia sp. CT2-14]|uniref:NAD(P)-binding protein n=1 Tax=Nocardia aurantiaca TaxID=2675850 RepID=A0A6I3L292_9NOCA|nr:NAD(P)-binding protein [Nocardia aurantiaca]